ncbi:acyltransferase family protein [Actinomadura flavalba]|uniref:acyltransferase family protein n=1 Tax=Actinomadura flavalba TaxID=1120938 RepID=UPI0003735219|nr:acyltransferase family protein [Actinomadura flavalba]
MLLTRPSSRPTTSAIKLRDPYFDNAKFLAVTLVVIGHAWEPLRYAGAGGRTLEAAHLLVYAFHLPVFSLICGYFSRGFPTGRNRTRKLVSTIVAPYLLFSLGYTALAGLLDGQQRGWDPFQPFYLTWFLLALLIWRLSVPLWLQIKRPVLVATAISVVSGFITLPTALNTAQVLSFLPFFVLGLTVRPERLALLRRRAARWIGAAVLVVGAGVAYLVAGNVDAEWVHWRRSFAQLGVTIPAGTGFSVVALAAAFALTLAFLAVVPARGTWFSGYGSATMYAYLLHGVPIMWMGYQSWYYGLDGWQIIGVTAGCVALTVLLSSRPVRAVTAWAVEPRMGWLFRDVPRHVAAPVPPEPDVSQA